MPWCQASFTARAGGSRVDAKGDCEHKPAKRQRKEALLDESCHPALEAKYEHLMEPARAREQPVEFFHIVSQRNHR